MRVGPHTESGDECKASAALLPDVNGNIRTLADSGALRHASGTAAQAMVGDPRCWVHAGRFGMLWLTALTFSLTKKAQAADPNVTLLDDDSITYKDLEHGAFELVTKEAVPRRIIVDDPGETIVLSRSGSSVSVSPSANTRSRMEELQAAQQDVYANLVKGQGPSGSGASPFVDQLPLQRINFIQPDTATTPNFLPPPDFINVVVPEIIFGKIPPQPPTLNAATGPSEIDTVLFDAFTATSGTFVASSPRSDATFVYSISGGTSGTAVLDGVTYDTSKTGLYGTLYVSSTTGAYTYVPNSDAINALTALTTESFTVTVSDGTLSANQTFTITLNGVNDAAIISGATTGAVIETGSAAPGALTATGTLTDTDVDNPPNTFAAVSSPTKSAGGHGTFTITAAGVWTYTLNNVDSTVQALNVGDTLTDSFTVTTVDGTPQVVTITVTGANDTAIISGDTTGAVIEASATTAGAPTSIGTLTDTDVDNPPNTFTAVSSPTASAGGYGTFTITAAGAWTYALNNANGAVQALNAGDTLTDTFTVTSIDGTAQVVTITIIGTNDSAVISGTTTGSVVEASGVANAAPGAPTATGTLTAADADNAANTFTAVNSPTASAGGYGTFTMAATGAWLYTLNNANNTVQALNVGDTLTDSFTVTTIDGTAQVVTIIINGANDAAIVSGVTIGAVIETGATPGTPTASGTLTDSDVDNTPNTFTAVNSQTASAGGYGTFTMTAAGIWTYTLDDNNSVVQALDVGDTLTDTFTVTTVDGTAQQVTITIQGASDADPNDFDNLATGTNVISDPPFVYGTPQGDSIAGGGDEGQIIYGGAGDDTINGTGKADTIYAGSGNDTVKGNDGDDTIYGGSGVDTINANNGNDTIIGGFGGDFLTGSNGDDRFVYLSVADSNSAQFDVISDFRSGSDKIDLAALGALAFLALNFASTSVPPHTIAWIYDSAANETIVYVNPTDQTLTIGSSGLLEIHLQGIVGVEASDFVHTEATASAPVAGESVDLALIAAAAIDDKSIVTATTAEASSGWTVSDGTLLTDWNWTVRTVGKRDSFDFASDGESRTDSTGSTNDDAAIATPTSGPSVEVHHIDVTAPTEKNLTLDQKPALDTKIHGANFAAPNNDMFTPSQVNQGQTKDHDGGSAQSHNDRSSDSATHVNSQSSNEDHASKQDHKSTVVKETALADDAQGNASHGGPNSGAPKVHGNAGDDHLSNSGEANKHDTASEHAASDIQPATTDGPSGSAAADKHGHEDLFHFKDKIPGPKASDVVENDSETNVVTVQISPSDKTADPDYPPTVSEIAQLIESSPSNHHPSDHSNHGVGHMGNFYGHAADDLML
jgi:VCBS repeat-containing protein